MNIFSKISTFVSFYYFSKCNIYASCASTLSKGNDLFLLFIFFPALILSRQQFKGMIQIHLPVPPLRVWVLHVFFSSCASLQIIFHAAPGKKRLVIPYDRPFKQKCRDAGGLCGGYTVPERVPKPPRTSGTFTLTPGAARCGVIMPSGV